jgi:hypothetical protein
MGERGNILGWDGEVNKAILKLQIPFLPKNVITHIFSKLHICQRISKCIMYPNSQTTYDTRKKLSVKTKQINVRGGGGGVELGIV